jgi:hypothetical protein
MEIWLVVLGGVIAMVGGFFGTFIQARFARRIRMDQVIAEQKVEVNRGAYSRAKRLETMLTHFTEKETYNKALEYEDWFWHNRLFMPGEVAQKWIEIRSALSKLAVRAQAGRRDPKEFARLEADANALIKEAITEIYDEMNLKALTVPSERKHWWQRFWRCLRGTS